MKRSKKVIMILLCALLFIVGMIPAVVYADAPYLQDFTTYTEYDPQSHFTITASKIDVDNQQHKYAGAVYKDFGTGFWDGDFEVRWKTTFGSSSVYQARFLEAVFLETGSPTQYWNDYHYYNSNGVGIKRQYTSLLGFQIWEGCGGTSYTTAWDGISTSYLGTAVYPKFIYDRDDGTYGTYYLYVYSDSGYTTEIFSTSLVAHRLPEFRYFCGYMNYGWSGGSTQVHYCDIEDMYLSDEEKTVTTTAGTNTSYSPYTGLLKLTANCTITGEPTSTFMAYSFDQETYYPATAYETDTEGVYEATWDIDSQYEGDTIYYYGYAWWNTYYDEGSELSSTLTVPEGQPTAYIYDWPIYIGDGQDVSLTGEVFNDGGLSCNATIAYSTDNWSTWFYTTNQTGLYTDDQYYGYVNMTEDTWYRAHAVVWNEQGSDNSSDIMFIWYNQSQPSCTTDSVTRTGESFLNNEYIQIEGTVEDDGGGDCIVGIDYRILPTGEWIELWTSDYPNELYETDDTISGTFMFAMGSSYEVRVKVANEVGYNWLTEEWYWYYGDTVQVTTIQAYTTPVIGIPSFESMSESMCKVTTPLLSDGGYACATWIEYRLNGSATVTSTFPSRNSLKETGDSFIQYMNGLEVGRSYQVRGVASNLLGYIGYGDWEDFDNWSDEAGGDADDDIVPESDLKPMDWFAVNVLGVIGMNNSGGKLLFVILAMMILFGIFFKSSFFRVFMPVLVFVAFLVFGWIPVEIVICVILGAGLGAWYLFKKAV